MTVETHVEPSAGIYVTTHTEATGDDAIELLKLTAKRDAHRREHWLDDAETHVQDLAAVCAGLNCPDKRRVRIRDEVAKRLSNAALLCGTIRRYRDDGDVKSALRYAYELGRIVEACVVRLDAEWAAGVGKRQVKYAAAGTTKDKGTREELAHDADRRWLLWQAEQVKHPTWTKTAIDETVAAADGCSARTVKRVRLSRQK